jgi:CheY-like chemotaxis protein/glycine cleavage system H lipoate-binding protein
MKTRRPVRDVLVVEDDRVVLAAVARLCRLEGLEVDETDSVAEALDRLAQAAYRLVVVDLMLPGQSGLELVRNLGADKPAPPVVVISGYATSENALESFRLGSFDFLPKPFDVTELLGVLRRALRYGASRSERAPAVGGRRYFLGRHAWAALDADGTATVGAAETFAGLLGESDCVRLPAAGDHVGQGRRLARVEGGDEAHRIWSPLSGRVVAVNSGLCDAGNRLGNDPFGAGWVARIVPANLEHELEALTIRRAEGVAPAEGG